jgi:methyltransferase family protein
MANAYQASQAIHVAATLGIADLLEDGPRSTEELAHATHTHAPSLYRLLRALSSVGVFAEYSDGRFGLTPLAEHLRTDAPSSLRAWAMFLGRPHIWSAWAYLLDSVRTGEAAFPKLHGTSSWEYWASRPEEGAIFDAAMTGLSALAAEAIVGSPYRPSPRRLEWILAAVNRHTMSEHTKNSHEAGR